MAKSDSTSSETASSVEVNNPKLEASTLADRLDYAMQADADPRQVLREIVSLVTPFCARRNLLGNIRSLIQEAGVFCFRMVIVNSTQLAYI